MPYATKEQKREYMRGYLTRWRKKNPDKERAKQLRHYIAHRPDLRRNYGITLDDLNRMVAAQDGKCALCGAPLKRNYVDHDHATGKVRGVVCCRCNIRLSAVDDTEWMEKARQYKEKSHASHPDNA
jgi:hypothetical protein